jgi:hypothetical protein
MNLTLRTRLNIRTLEIEPVADFDHKSVIGVRVEEAADIISQGKIPVG